MIYLQNFMAWDQVRFFFLVSVSQSAGHNLLDSFGFSFIPDFAELVFISF